MLLRTVAWIIVAMGLALPAAAQTSHPDATIQALLAEVRQLRLALERSALLVPRMQIAMQRLQLQDQRVARTTAQLDVVQREIAGQAIPSQHATQELTVIEQQLSVESDAARRKQLEQQRAHLRLMSAQVINPQLLARESELASSLRNERAALEELTEKLASMERLLDASQPATGTPGRPGP